MNNITPGTLCFIKKGPMTGSSVTALRLAPEKEVEAILCKKMGLKNVILDGSGPIWEVDRMITWIQRYTGATVKIPYEIEKSLFPIPPLADPLDVKQEEEKPCTA